MADLRSLKKRKLIAANIDRAIAESGLSMWRVAQKTGIHYNTLNNWVSYDSVKEAAQEYGVAPSHISRACRSKTRKLKIAYGDTQNKERGDVLSIM